MQKKDNYWKRFERTGGVADYLNYTACARECSDEPEEEDLDLMDDLDRYSDRYDSDEDEVEDDEWNAYREWDGSVGNADRRIR